MTRLEYENELRDTWLALVKNYPDLYDVVDYIEACNQVGILAF